jgi:hypothetical protein
MLPKFGFADIGLERLIHQPRSLESLVEARCHRHRPPRALGRFRTGDISGKSEL